MTLGEQNSAHRQNRSRIRFDWGPTGVDAIAPDSDVVVVVDVLSFTTTLSVAVEAGIAVAPCRWLGDRAVELSTRLDATLAVRRSDAAGDDISLSPATVRSRTDPPARLVLPSPNGSTIARRIQTYRTVCIGASLRNARSVAAWIGEHHPAGVIAVIAAGERWPDDSLRPAVEDLWGAGAVISALASHADVATAQLSPESAMAASAWLAVQRDVQQELRKCASGLELIASGYPQDVDIAAEIDSSDAVPVLRDEFFVRA